MRCLVCTYIFLFFTSWIHAQNSCASPATVTDGGCTTMNISLNSGALLTGCNGGSNPLAYISFTAPANGDCVQLNFSGITSGGTYQLATFTAGCASYVTNSAACVENVVAGQPFSYSSESSTGANLLTPGANYVLAIQADNTTSITTCMITPSAYASSDQCSGSQQIGTTATTLYNGGDCLYSGAQDNAASGDPAAIQLCAGSLENTQWTSFIASSTTIQIVGSGISCTGGGCGFQFGIFTGSCGSLTNIGCYGNKVCTGGQSTAGPTNPTGQVSWTGTSTSGFTATISGLTVGQTVYLAMDGNADADCTYSLAGVNVQALPVELSYFRGKEDNGRVMLEWLTMSELNSDYFSIERSLDNRNFEEIGWERAAGNSETPLYYSFYDNDPPAGLVYYRLMQYDLNGSSHEYHTIPVIIAQGEPVVIARYNMVGSAVDASYPGVIIEKLSDGTSRKVLRSE